jgi:hypothetical protein
MAYNGSGTYALPLAPVVAGTNITVTWANSSLSDIGTALTNALCKDGQSTPTANLKMGNYKFTGLGSGSARTDSLNIGQLQDGALIWLGTGGGTADAITASVSPAITAYAAGQAFRFIASGANTGAVTLNLNSVGNKAITKNGATALAAGDIPADAVCTVVYDGTQFQLVGVFSGSLNADLLLQAGKSIIFEGTTANDFETTLSGGDPTADRTIALPDATDTLVGKATADVLTNKTIDASQLVDASITAAKLDGAQSGSAPIFGARAWVNFDGSGVVAIRASGNVSSITDNGPGDYTVNFTTALPDANYAAVCMVSNSRQYIMDAANGGADPTASAFRFLTMDAAGNAQDCPRNLLAFFR